MVKNLLIMSASVFILAMLTGCGSKEKKDPIVDPNPILEPAKPILGGVPKDEYNIAICTEENKDDEACIQASEFNLTKKNVAVLSAPDDIRLSHFVGFGGNRFIVVKKDEKDISIFNALAQALVEYSEEPCAHPCPRLITAPIDYEEAKRMLKEDFKLTGTKEQNKALLDVFNYNLELLALQGLSLPQAQKADIKAMAESLVNLTVAVDLSSLGMSADGGAYCVREEYGTCVEWVGAGVIQSDIVYPDRLFLDKHEAAQIAYDIREKSDKPSEADKIFKQLECKDNEDKQIYMYGVDDNFDPVNPEPTNPSASFLAQFPSVYTPLMHGYDHDVESINQPSLFVETLDGLPADLTQGIFAISLKEKGYKLNDDLTIYFDKYSIGSGYYGTSTDNAEGNISTIRTTWTSPSTNIYYEDMSQITTTSGQSLLSKVQSGQTALDTTIIYTTNVNFIAIAACVPKPKPETTPIPEIPVKLQCDLEKGEELLTIWGGVADDFALESDPVTPSAALLSMVTTQDTIRYDEPIKKLGTLIDTINHPNMHISQMEVLVNTRPSQAPGGTANDRINLGSVASSTNASFASYDPNAVGVATPNGGTAHMMYGGDTVYSMPNGNSAGNLLSLMNATTSGLDIIVGDQTEVDTVRWSMCVVKEYEEPCPDSDGDGVCDDDDCDPKDPTVWEGCDDINVTKPPESCNQNFKIDLSQASSWVDASGDHPTVSSGPSVWDNSMNWFHFGNVRDSIHELELDFCACGDTSIVVNKLKTDNSGKIYLDTDPTPHPQPLSWSNSSYIAAIDSYHAWSFESSGPLFNGSQFVSNSTGSGVDHTLHFDVKNNGGPVGGAVNGSLSFVGHLGKCTPEDLDVPEDDDTVVVDPNNNWTVTQADGEVAVITDITWNPAPDTPEGNGTVIIGIAGPVISTNPGGKPFIDYDPSVVIDLSEIEQVGLDASVIELIYTLVKSPK